MEIFCQDSNLKLLICVTFYDDDHIIADIACDHAK